MHDRMVSLRALRAALAGLTAASAFAWVASCATTSGTSSDPATEGRLDDESHSPGVAAYTMGRGYEARRATGRAQIGEAMRVLETAGEACGVACPAVQTLRIGVHQMCGVSETKEDDKVCREVSADLVAVAKRLTPSCGPCATRPDAGAADEEDASP